MQRLWISKLDDEAGDLTPKQDITHQHLLADAFQFSWLKDVAIREALYQPFVLIFIALTSYSKSLTGSQAIQHVHWAFGAAQCVVHKPIVVGGTRSVVTVA